MSRTYPGGAVSSYTFDDDGQMTTAVTAEGTTTYGHDAAGNVVLITTPDGSTDALAWDTAGRLTETSHTAGGGRTSSQTYTLDAVGNPTHVGLTGSPTLTTGIDYLYDALDRLRRADYYCPIAQFHNEPQSESSSPDTCFSEGFTYDPVGNRSLRSDTSGGLTSQTTTYAYDAADRLLEAVLSTTLPSVVSSAPASDAGSWQNGANGYLSGDRYATVSPPLNQVISHDYHGFDFSGIPAGATIDSVTVQVEWAVSSTNAQATLTAAARLNGTQVGSTLTDARPSTTDTVKSTSFNGVSRDDLVNGDLAVQVTATKNGGSKFTARLDAVTVSVRYTQVQMTYTYDANGNQTAAGADTFTYDLADRLTSASMGSVNETYTYAGDGTRLSAATGTRSERQDGPAVGSGLRPAATGHRARRRRQPAAQLRVRPEEAEGQRQHRNVLVPPRPVGIGRAGH